MDLRQYFRKIREVEATIDEAHTFVSSLETPDGGKAGMISEVPRSVAAKMIVEGRAMLATKGDREQYLEEQSAARSTAKQADLARKLQVTIVSDSDGIRSVPQSVPGTNSKK